MAFKITRDAGGVPGLMLAENVFSEAAEKHYFGLTGASEHQPTAQGARVDKVIDGHFGPIFPQEIYEVLNAVRDCGLLPGLFNVNYCMPITYRAKSSFQVRRPPPPAPAHARPRSPTARPPPAPTARAVPLRQPLPVGRGGCGREPGRLRPHPLHARQAAGPGSHRE